MATQNNWNYCFCYIDNFSSFFVLWSKVEIRRCKPQRFHLSVQTPIKRECLKYSYIIGTSNSFVLRVVHCSYSEYLHWMEHKTIIGRYTTDTINTYYGTFPNSRIYTTHLRTKDIKQIYFYSYTWIFVFYIFSCSHSIILLICEKRT